MDTNIPELQDTNIPELQDTNILELQDTNILSFRTPTYLSYRTVLPHVDEFSEHGVRTTSLVLPQATKR